MPVPFFGEEFTFVNPDGSEVQVIGWGNQHHAVFETLDGFTVVQNPESRFYEYARLSADKSDLVPSGTRVGAADPETLSLVPHVRVRHEAARALADASAERLGGTRRWEVRRQQKRALLESLQADAAPPQFHTTGDYVGLCLLIAFPDVAATIGQQEVDDFCNQQGYSNYANNGSVYDYFFEVSAGKFRYTNIVTAYYTAANNRSHYTDPQVGYGTRARQLIVEALDNLKAQGFDFTQLSIDDGGYIYALNVFYAGPRVNNWAEGLWPHAWVLASPYEVGGGRRFSDYQITNMGSQLTLRTFCHENGHMVCDLPDLYDYGGQSSGIGNYCLMCSGGSNVNPVHVNPYLKYKAGWATAVTEITPGISGTVAAGTNGIYKYTKGASEYFVIENRQQQGRDAAIPDAGLAIWHVDELGSNEHEHMTATQHYECSLEQADGRFDLEGHANGGDSDDLYAAPYHDEFSATTTPASTWWDGTDSGLDIRDISASGTTMTFNTPGGDEDMAKIDGTWQVVGVDWGCDGGVAKASPFTFNPDGTWTYNFGGGRWIQVGNMVAWNFDNAAGLLYTATVSPHAMNGIMGYASATRSSKGCFFALRQPSPGSPDVTAAVAAAAAAIGAAGQPAGDAAVGPV